MSAPLCSLVSGALSEIAALGNQDQHLYCSPEETLWAQAYSRITNFAMAEQDVCFNNAPSGSDWSAQSCVTAEIQRAGDLLADVYFVARLSACLPLPAFAGNDLTAYIWTPAVGFALIQRARLQIGSQQIEELRDSYLMMHDEVHRAEGKRQGLQVGDYGRYFRGARSVVATDVVDRDEDTIVKAIDYSSRAQQLLVHLPFHMSDQPGNALNIVGLQYHQVCVELDLRAEADLRLQLVADRVTEGEVVLAKAAGTGTKASISEAKLRAIFIHLDTPERRVRAQQPVTMMFIYPQNQSISVAVTDQGTQKDVRNYFNHPVVDFLWAYHSSASVTRGEYFVYGAYSAPQLTLGGAGSTSAQEVFNAIEQVEVDLNNHTRICGRGDYFSKAIPRARSSRQPSRIVNQYSFAYSPGDTSRPTGSLNLSRIDNVIFKFTFRATGTGRETIGNLVAPGAAAAQGSILGALMLHARTINFYRQAGGMLGLMFAN